MNLTTIGFTKKPASRFFGLLRESGARRLIDVRLNNISQLAGFTKRDDLAYFLKELCGMEYIHLPILAPTPGMLDAFKKRRIDWDTYAIEFLSLMEERSIETTVDRDLFNDACLLCSEDTAHHCHRRLVVEYLNRHWGELDVVHLQ